MAPPFIFLGNNSAGWWPVQTAAAVGTRLNTPVNPRVCTSRLPLTRLRIRCTVIQVWRSLNGLLTLNLSSVFPSGSSLFPGDRRRHNRANGKSCYSSFSFLCHSRFENVVWHHVVITRDHHQRAAECFSVRRRGTRGSASAAQLIWTSAPPGETFISMFTRAGGHVERVGVVLSGGHVGCRRGGTPCLLETSDTLRRN